MLLFEDATPYQEHCIFQRSRGQTIGFVPTMGNLHEGHLSLVDHAKTETGFVVVSIFVNPLQFNDPQDFKKYPQTFEKDLELLKEKKVDIVFHPNVDGLYGKHQSTQIIESKISKFACGRFRPGHFEGVCKVVLKLLNLTGPHKIYLGEKDYQQVQVIKRMVEDISFPTVVRACPTIRTASGLAMSSRNSLLSPEDQDTAAGIYKSLIEMKVLSQRDVQIRWAEVEVFGRAVFQKEMENKFELEYLEAFTQNHFKPLAPEDVLSEPIVICVAGKISNIRLIDNILLPS